MNINDILKVIKQSDIKEKDGIIEKVQQLANDSLFLAALVANGVDNWVWYDVAQDDYEKWKEEDKING